MSSKMQPTMMIGPVMSVLLSKNIVLRIVDSEAGKIRARFWRLEAGRKSRPVRATSEGARWARRAAAAA